MPNKVPPNQTKLNIPKQKRQDGTDLFRVSSKQGKRREFYFRYVPLYSVRLVESGDGRGVGGNIGLPRILRRDVDGWMDVRNVQLDWIGSLGWKLT